MTQCLTVDHQSREGQLRESVRDPEREIEKAKYKVGDEGGALEQEIC